MSDNRNIERAGLGNNSRESEHIGQLTVAELYQRARPADRAWIAANLENRESLFYNPELAEMLSRGEF